MCALSSDFHLCHLSAAARGRALSEGIERSVEVEVEFFSLASRSPPTVSVSLLLEKGTRVCEGDESVRLSRWISSFALSLLQARALCRDVDASAQGA